MRRTIRHQLSGWLFLAVTLHSAAIAGEEQPTNVILVMSDDQGWGDVGYNGHQILKTPHLDAMAGQCLRFNRFYSSSPVCSPTRGSCLTGRHPYRYGILYANAGGPTTPSRYLLPNEEITLAEVLAGRGYRTGHFGKWHMGGQRNVADAPPITAYGFDASLTNFEGMGPKLLPLVLKPGQEKPGRIWGDAERLGAGYRWMLRSKITSGFVDEAIPFIRKARAAKKPFYVNLWPDDVHSPFWPPVDKWADGKRGLYHSVLQEMDRQFGKLFDLIRGDESLRNNTLVMICSDNGPEMGAGSAGPFRGFKTHLYEGGIRSSLIAWGPGLLKKKNHVDSETVFSAIDLVPTLLEPLARELIERFASSGEADLVRDLTRPFPFAVIRSLLGLPEGDEADGDNDLPDLAIREGIWKLLCEYDGSEPELYDISRDRGEQESLANKHPEIVARMAKKLIAWHQSMPPDNGAAYVRKPKGKKKRK